MAEIKIGSGIVAARVESNDPSSYRLARRNGVLILQGAFQWRQGSDGGWTWRDIPTVELEGAMSGVAVTQPLSPAAQAVIDAAHRKPAFNPDGRPNLSGAVAAALRAAADSAPTPHRHEEMAFHSGFWAGIKYIRSIATELEGLNG